MYARTSYSAEAFPSFMVPESETDFESEDFFAGEPVCPQPQKHAETVSYSNLFLLLALTVGCAFASDEATRQDWTAKFERVASSLTAAEQSSSLPSRDVASTEPAAPAAIPPPSTPAAVIAAQPLPEVRVTNAPGDTENSDDGKTPGKTRVSDAYAPPQLTSDPYRRKAEAVGLHPDLSRAVLTRLTPADYRNAAFAIQKAIKTVPDDGDFTWPRSRKSGTAVFNVHFVQGGAQDCRRYVVTVTKDRWTSTALPMEKCGVRVASRSSEKEKSVE
ncbi:hypothetical protein [Hyphomicrobium sp.]|jgi:hypothetical protein|uniref:hypothetical protein n=1 Tax=Hyphomicrobium sp. TaxID=82 RepID=UPI003567BF22